MSETDHPTDKDQPDPAVTPTGVPAAEPAMAPDQPSASQPPAPQPMADAAAEPAGPDQTEPPAEVVEPIPPDEQALRIAEALVFSSATPVAPRSLKPLLPDGMDPAAVLGALRDRYAGRGVELVEAAGGVQFRTAADLGPVLRKVVEVPRRLPRVAMETLAIIAYHQPVTRPEIEEIRGTALSQQTLDTLLEANLVAPKGRRESPGRPTLWGTTPQFLAQFGLNDLRDLPRREDLLLEPPQPSKPDPAADAAEPAEASASPDQPGAEGAAPPAIAGSAPATPSPTAADAGSPDDD